MSLLAPLQQTSRQQKARRFYETMSPTKDDTVLVVGAGDGTDLIADYPWKAQVWALDADADHCRTLAKTYPAVHVVCADFLNPDDLTRALGRTFSLGYSNAVLEHVADHGRFAAHLRRLCTRYWVTTPNKYWPVDMHSRLPVYHWLPESWQVKVVFHLRPGHYRDGIHEPLSYADAPELRRLFPDATVQLLWPGYTLLVMKQ